MAFIHLAIPTDVPAHTSTPDAGASLIRYA